MLRKILGGTAQFLEATGELADAKVAGVEFWNHVRLTVR